jgi:hypothetical protein
MTLFGVGSYAIIMSTEWIVVLPEMNPDYKKPYENEHLDLLHSAKTNWIWRDKKYHFFDVKNNFHFSSGKKPRITLKSIFRSEWWNTCPNSLLKYCVTCFASK